MSNLRMPALFVSHGTPMTALLAEDPSEDAYAASLRAFAEGMGSPKAIVIVSAHGSSSDGVVEISASQKPSLIYDFRGFPGELYLLTYPCPGDPMLSAKIAGLLSGNGLKTALNTTTGLDHGVWVPLSIMYPRADIPVVQLHLPEHIPGKPPADIFLRVGHALASLREEGVLIVGSGGAVHNLGELVWHEKHHDGAKWARQFESWLVERLNQKDVAGLLDYADSAPSVGLAHPTDEHFLPIFFTIGASLKGDELKTVFEGIQYRSLSMFSFALVS